jgi:transposase
MTITTVGIDLAKNVFAVHCVDQNGKTVLVKSRVTRAALPGLIAGLPPCVIGMEACSGAHYWARLFRQYGHEPRLMAAKFVSPYRMAGKSGKNDAADAQAICEAVRRHICGLCRLRMRASRQCSVCIVPDRVLSKRKQQHIIVSGVDI